MGAHLLPQTSKIITSTRGKSLTESQLETGRSSPMQPGLRDSHGTGKDRRKQVGTCTPGRETKRKREIRGSKQAKPQTEHPNSGVCRIRILYTNIHYTFTLYAKVNKRGLKT